MDYEELHKDIHLPCVRVIAQRAGGSGTVIYSQANEAGEFSTFVLTNHHVVNDLIKVKEKWNPILQREVKEDERGTANVHFFEYMWKSRATGGISVDADIVAYSKEEDLALLKLRTDRPVPSVARIHSRDVSGLRIGMPVFAVGAGLLEPPVMTGGFLSQFGREIEDREFWLNTAPSIFGNSGGALFLADTHELIGVPSRIAVQSYLMSIDAITHLSFAIPIDRVWKFLEDQRFRFIEDPGAFTEDGEAEERKRLRDRDLQERAKKGE